MQQPKKGGRNEKVVKPREDRGCPGNPPETKGKNKPPCPRNPEGNPNCLLTKLAANFGADDFRAANGEGPDASRVQRIDHVIFAVIGRFIAGAILPDEDQNLIRFGADVVNALDFAVAQPMRA